MTSDMAPARKRWLKLVYGSGLHPARPMVAARMLQGSPDLAQGGDPYLACALGDANTLRRKCKADPSWANTAGGPLGMPPLVAVTFSSLVQIPEFEPRLLESAKLLLESGADPNSSWVDPVAPDTPLSALYGAAGRNHVPAMVRLLLDAHANPNDGESLYHSVESPDLECTRLLLDAGAKIEGSNALFHVLDFKHLPTLQLLLERGADVNEPSGRLDFPIHHAIRRCCGVECIDALLERGADPRARARGGLSPYLLAVRYGLSDVAQRLRELAGDEQLSVADQFVGACARADREEARRILEVHPDLIDKLSESQLRQLPNLAQVGHSDAVRVMVELGWPVSVRGGDWSASALNHTVFRGDAALTRLLLQHGASWTEHHGFDDNVVGTLSYASSSEPVQGGDWLGCAKALVESGMPVPDVDYTFSDEIETYFAARRRTR